MSRPVSVLPFCLSLASLAPRCFSCSSLLLLRLFASPASLASLATLASCHRILFPQLFPAPSRPLHLDSLDSLAFVLPRIPASLVPLLARSHPLRIPQHCILSLCLDPHQVLAIPSLGVESLSLQLNPTRSARSVPCRWHILLKVGNHCTTAYYHRNTRERACFFRLGPHAYTGFHIKSCGVLENIIT